MAMSYRNLDRLGDAERRAITADAERLRHELGAEIVSIAARDAPQLAKRPASPRSQI